MKLVKIPVVLDANDAIKYPDKMDQFGSMIQEGEFLIGEYHGKKALTKFAGVWPRPIPEVFKETFEPIDLLNQFTSDELIAGLVAGGQVAAQIQVLAMNRKGRDINILDQNFIDAMTGLETAKILTTARKNELKKGIKVKNNES